MARVTGLEPATSGVTGRRSNHLSYTRIVVTGELVKGLGAVNKPARRNEKIAAKGVSARRHRRADDW